MDDSQSDFQDKQNLLPEIRKTDEKKTKPDHAGHRKRLRERFLNGGDDALADYEVLELLLFSAIPRRDVKPIAKKLLSRFKNLAGVLTASKDSLASAGLSDNSIASIKIVQLAAVKMIRQQVIHKSVISSWSQLIDYLYAVMAHEMNEHFRILFLDKKNALIADEVQQKGTVDFTPVFPREVAKRALEVGATAIIMVHNHPSGDPTPSQADILMTEEVKRALSGIGVILHDHVVIGNSNHFSFKSSGLL